MMNAIHQKPTNQLTSNLPVIGRPLESDFHLAVFGQRKQGTSLTHRATGAGRQTVAG